MPDIEPVSEIPSSDSNMAARHPCCARAVSAKGFSEFGDDHMVTSVKWRPGYAIRFRKLFGGSSSSYQILGRYPLAQDRPKLCSGLFVFGQTGGRATLSQPVSQVRLAPSNGARCEPDRLGKGAGLDTAPNRGPSKACDLSDFAGSQDPIERLLGHLSPQGEIERDPLNKPETDGNQETNTTQKCRDKSHRDLSRLALPCLRWLCFTASTVHAEQLSNVLACFGKRHSSFDTVVHQLGNFLSAV